MTDAYRGAFVVRCIALVAALGLLGCSGTKGHTARDEGDATWLELRDGAVSATDKTQAAFPIARQRSESRSVAVPIVAGLSRLDNASPYAHQLLALAISRLNSVRGGTLDSSPKLTQATRPVMLALLAEELSMLEPESIAHEFDEWWRALGVIPAFFDSRRALLEGVEKQPPSVYLLTRQRIVLPTQHPNEAIFGSLVHEVVHARQDSLYRLKERLSYQAGMSDRIAAYHALAEGEALQLELEIVDSGAASLPTVETLRARFARNSHFISLPPLLRRATIAPYLDGYRFVSYVRRLGGFPLLDRIWTRGLCSTKELLHPEQWIASCLADKCESTCREQFKGHPLFARPRVKVSVSDAIGEQGLRLLLEEVNSEDKATRLAKPLESDRLTVVPEGSGRAFCWQLHLDGAGSSKPLCEALASLVGASVSGQVSTNCVVTDRAVVALNCAERDIVVLAQSPSEADSRGICHGMRGAPNWDFCPLSSD